MGILSWIVFGLLAGAVAKWLHPGPDPGGCILTFLLGVGGSIVGGFLGTLLGFGSVTGFNLHSFLIAVAGAVVLLVAYGALSRRR